jgi:hypothetical protein
MLNIDQVAIRPVLIPESCWSYERVGTRLKMSDIIHFRLAGRMAGKLEIFRHVLDEIN